MPDAALFFAIVQPGQRFRAWPPASQHDVYAGLILTATSSAQLAVNGDPEALYVAFTYPAWTGRSDGAVWRDATSDHRFELVGADAGDLCGCGRPGERTPDPRLTVEGLSEVAAARPLLLCPTCLTEVTALATAD